MPGRTGRLEDAARAGARAAVIATDTGRHRADALAALALGMHVLVEKPLAVDAAGAREIAEAARRAGRTALVACVLRFSESLGKFRELLPRVGSVHAVDIECRSYLPDWRPARDYRASYSARAGEGGVLRDLIHELDYALWLFGPAQEPQGRCANLGRLGIEAEETADLAWTARGARVTVGLDYLGKPPVRRMTAEGERGTLSWDGMAQTVELRQEGSTERFESRQTVDERFCAQAAAFLSALDGKADDRLCPPQDAIAALELCDLARAHQGQRA